MGGWVDGWIFPQIVHPSDTDLFTYIARDMHQLCMIRAFVSFTTSMCMRTHPPPHTRCILHVRGDACIMCTREVLSIDMPCTVYMNLRLDVCMCAVVLGHVT